MIKRGTLCWWVAPSGTKFIAVAMQDSVTKSGKARDEVYVVGPHCGHHVPTETLRPTTVAAVIRYQRRKWDRGAALTRHDVALAMRKLDW